MNKARNLCNGIYSELCRQLGDAHMRHKLYSDLVARFEKEIENLDKGAELIKVLDSQSKAANEMLAKELMANQEKQVETSEPESTPKDSVIVDECDNSGEPSQVAA